MRRMCNVRGNREVKDLRTGISLLSRITVVRSLLTREVLSDFQLGSKGGQVGQSSLSVNRSGDKIPPWASGAVSCNGSSI